MLLRVTRTHHILSRRKWRDAGRNVQKTRMLHDQIYDNIGAIQTAYCYPIPDKVGLNLLGT